jgi:lipopolysaccharide transport system ATP-binding protein
MSDIAIKIENLSKQYRLGNVGTGTLTHDLKSWWATARGKEDPNLQIGLENKLAEKGGDYVYALKDINLEIKKGDIVGVIGKNGAGKSTLLKILSRVTTPTTGSIDLYGRVASLLEVGTGFHPELTGRENIFLNGAIMGMSKQEIRSKFDEIVEFAGVGKYIDTPVKRYSSGMYVRLAFAVAAHLDPEILIVDEVLAVGDVEFQKKAIGKMQDVSRNEGRTILFVSHNMTALQMLCKNGILLNQGRIEKTSDNISMLIKEYLDYSISKLGYITEWTKGINEIQTNEYITPERIYFSDCSGISNQGILNKNDKLFINIILEANKLHKSITLGYSIFDEENNLLYWSYNTDINSDSNLISLGKNHLISQIPNDLLNEGIYRIELCGGIHDQMWFYEPNKKNPCIFLTVQSNTGQSTYWNYKRPTLIGPVLKWENKTLK